MASNEPGFHTDKYGVHTLILKQIKIERRDIGLSCFHYKSTSGCMLQFHIHRVCIYNGLIIDKILPLSNYV